jgi:glycerate dehydrogenase
MNDKPSIVIVDGYTLNPGDLSWEGLAESGDVTHFDRTPPDMVADRCAGAEIIVTNKAPIDSVAINAATRLKLIAVTATGYNIVDMEAARRKNVVVCNVPDYGTASVAQHTFALLLEHTNRVGVNNGSVHDGDWSKARDFCYSKAGLTELAGKVLGIVGLGKIGARVAELGRAFGMDVWYHSRSPRNTTLAKYADLSTLFSGCDVVTLHCPLTADNLRFVNNALLVSMKKSAVLINTARGQLVDEDALAAALNDGVIAGAALDVLSAEPPSADNPLLRAKNCIITPHNAWMSFEARSRMLTITEKNIQAFLQGSPINVVS